MKTKMDLPFPEKYYKVAKYFEYYMGDLEQTPLLTDEQRLLFYALRQQAEHGPCTAPQPSFWHMKERHKNYAWRQLGRMSMFEAMVLFVQQFERVLWALEHPDAAPATEASMKAAIDWPARLQELTVSAPNSEENGAEGVRNGASGMRSTEAADRQSPAAASPLPLSPLPACLSADEMKDWDSDIVEHTALSPDNIRYLATELMRARQILRQTRERAVATERHSDCSRADELPSPLPPVPPPHSTPGQPCSTFPVPPLKPVWTAHGKAMRTAIVPPVRFSARSLTEAAARPPKEALTVPGAAQKPAPARTADTSNSWLGW
ncbi:hypothetical protein ABL78_1481 [Leptomonas seymouri]|uniref:ACB domain-containing protein n=1 Tax=Leptomonas seymouri TaxID=5684 RepID=A0A0N1IMA6_LEPSE|nr:hypothetical protein ABL78_1481 [Leptomonas seymouri]|eukprot:KPI89355.1 hypothetical protein ABL78_1481 [Leptomonas seymouri]